MMHKILAMDLTFYNTVGLYDFDARCEMVKDIGFDGINIAVWDGTRWEECLKYPTVKEKFGLEVMGTYVVLNLELPIEHPHNAGILTMLENIESCDQIDLLIRSAGEGIPNSSPVGDPQVIDWLNKALEICERRNLEISLFPHIQFWMDNHYDAIRLCEKVNHPNLGIVMAVFHWYAGDGKNLRQFLIDTLPYSKKVLLCGSKRTPLGVFGVATIEPLDTGELDNFAVISTIKKMGYEGPLGVGMWEEGGDPYIKLKRSYDTLIGMIKRAEDHPNWVTHI